MTNPTAAGPAGPSQPGEWVADLTYTALDPLRSAGGTVALNGFFGWPLTTAAS